MSSKELATLHTAGAVTQSVELKVTTDDIVNVYVARHEAALMEQQRDIQRRVHELRADRTKLNKAIKARLTKMVDTESTTPFGCVTSRLSRVDNLPEQEENVTSVIPGYLTIVLTPKIDGVTMLKSSWEDSVKHKTEHEVRVQYDLTPNEQAQAIQINRGEAELMVKLMEVNTNLQQIEHKTRVLRGRLAEKKMAEMGVDPVFSDEELTKLLS